MNIDLVAYRVVVKGRVQGVGYRAWARETARRLGLRGWVRNLTDGTVEALVSGARADVQDFIAACRQGPALSRVADVETAVADASGMLDDFVQQPTGT
jgi:acylphosphatase